MSEAARDQRLLDPIRSSGDTSALVLFLAGLSGTPQQWDLVIPKLLDTPADLAYGAPILPHPAFGGARPTVARLAQALAAELRADPHGDVIIVAHSVGAFVALRIALEIPSKVRSVILVNGGLTTVAKFLDEPVRELLARPRTCLTAVRLFVLVGSPAPEPVKRTIAGGELCSRILFGGLVSDSTLRSQKQRRALVETAGGLGVLLALWDNRHHWPEFTSYAGEIATDVVLLAGEHDPLAGVDDTKEMAALLPNATIELLGGAGHAGPIETADAVADTIAEAVAAAPEP